MAADTGKKFDKAVLDTARSRLTSVTLDSNHKPVAIHVLQSGENTEIASAAKAIVKKIIGEDISVVNGVMSLPRANYIALRDQLNNHGFPHDLIEHN